MICIGYNRKYVWAISYCCRKLNIPTILLLIGWENERPRIPIKELIKRVYCSNIFLATMVPGARAVDYAHKLGFPTKNIWVVGNVVDNDHFAQLDKKSKPNSLGTPYPHFLTVTRLSLEKNIQMLLEAFSEYRRHGGNWHLNIVGTGPDEQRLKSIVSAQDEAFIHWLGWKQYDDLPEVYANADCFILPSLIEPWGLVVNEAMAAGLPVLVSQNCGCLPELCWRGVNGFDFSPDDVNELSSLMLSISNQEHDRTILRQASLDIIRKYTPVYWAKAVAGCVKQTSQNFSH